MLMRILRATAFAFAACLAFSAGGAAFAHPHVWVSVETDVNLGPDGEVTGFRHKWTFDEMYAQFATAGLDTNGDGILDEEELKPLAQTNVEALKEFEYFTFPFVGTTKVPLKAPIDYRLDYKDNLLTLSFTLPLEAPIPYEKIKDFSFSVYDPGMYVSLAFNGKTAVKVVSAKPAPCSAAIGDLPSPATKETTLAQMGEAIDPSSNVGARFAERVVIACKP
jgi:ABC-type uncharacterized transport system substrate-binding protein